MIEVRRVRATDDELKRLIGNLMGSTNSGDTRPAKEFIISSMAYASVKPVKLDVVGRYGDSRPVSVVITPELLVTSFVLYCLEHGVPICRNSAKTVSKTKEGVAFDMVVSGLGVDPAIASPEQIRSAFNPAGPAGLGKTPQAMPGLALN